MVVIFVVGKLSPRAPAIWPAPGSLSVGRALLALTLSVVRTFGATRGVD